MINTTWEIGLGNVYKLQFRDIFRSLEPDPSIHIVVGSGKLVLSMVPMTLKGEMSFSVIESH